MLPQDISFYKQIIRKFILSSYIQLYLDKFPPEKFVEIIGKIFSKRQESMDWLAIYLKREVEERNHPLNIVVGNLVLFTHTFVAYIDWD